MKNRGARCVALGLAMTWIAQSAEAATKLHLDIPAGTLLSCLERLALAAHVRIVDHSGEAAQARCEKLEGDYDFDSAMQHLLPRGQLQWRRLDAGTVEFSPAAPTRLDLDQLSIDGAPVPESGGDRPRGPAPTLLADAATATTRIDRHWLDTAPLVSIAQIARYAPNLYGSGCGITIRGVVRNNLYSSASAFSLDGLDLGGLLLDNDLVPLQGLEQIDIVRGPRAFEAGVKSAAGGVRLYTPSPSPDTEAQASVAIGSKESWLTSAGWCGLFGDTGLGANVLLQRRVLPDDLEQVRAPTADIQKRRNDGGRARLSFQPSALAGLSAEVSALTVDGDSSDRIITVPGGKDPAHLDRKNFDRNVNVGETHDRGAAASVRYGFDQGSSLRAYASALTAERDSSLQPLNNSFVIQHENNAHAGLVYTSHPADDWTLDTGVDRSRNGTQEDYENLRVEQKQRLSRQLRSDSAWAWLERDWGQTWNAGLGLRWVREELVAGYQGRYPGPPSLLHEEIKDCFFVQIATLQ